MLSFHSCPRDVGRPSSIWWGCRASPVVTIFRAVLQDITGRGIRTNKLSAATDLLVPLRYDHARKGSGGQISIVRLFRQRRSIPSTSRTGKAELTFASEPSNFLFSYLFTFFFFFSFFLFFFIFLFFLFFYFLNFILFLNFT